MNKPFYDVGLYCSAVVSQGLTKASTGTSQFVMRIKILGVPQDDGSYIPVQQQYERTIYMALTEKTMPFVAEALKLLDYTGTGLGPLDPSHPLHVSFAGQQVDVWCKHEADQQGTLREKWQVSKPTAALDLKPLTPRETRDLDALFGKSLIAKPVPAKAAQPQALPGKVIERSGRGVSYAEAAGSDPGITDDDIPF